MMHSIYCEMPHLILHASSNTGSHLIPHASSNTGSHLILHTSSNTGIAWVMKHCCSLIHFLGKIGQIQPDPVILNGVLGTECIVVLTFNPAVKSQVQLLVGTLTNINAVLFN